MNFNIALMKPARVLGLILSLCLVVAARAAEPGVLTVAVLDFESKDAAVHDLGPKAATMINATLSAEPQIVTVERAEIDKLLSEQELGLSGTVSAATAAKVGQLTGAKVLVIGRVFKVEKDTVMVAKIISTETSRVYGEMVKGAAAKSIAEWSEELAKKVAKVIADKGDTLVAKAETREEKIARMIKALPAGKRPSVSVKIAERHFGAPVIDPAAETELSIILQKAGFTVVDDKSEQKPEIEISGEAFSAFGLRKGNLISCRARVELKVHKQGSGKILASDRQTSVAMDIAEQIAAKTALQNAAVELAERLVPTLAKP
jgi:hypothetical protein